MTYTAEVKDGKEEEVGDGLYRVFGTGQIVELKGSKVRVNRTGSILTRRKRFKHDHASFRKFVRTSTDHVLPHEFLS